MMKKKKLKTLLSLHFCVNIYKNLALLKKEIYFTRCWSDTRWFKYDRD